MIPYTLHVGLLLTVCLLFYKLLLQKETYYRLNRIVLLACLAMVFVLPLIQVPQQWALRNSSQVQVAEPVVMPKNLPILQSQLTLPAQSIIQPIQAIHPVQQPSAPQESLMQRIFNWAVYLYWFGVAVFGANLLMQVTVLLWQVYRRPSITDGQFRIIELDDDRAPCSFGNNIFINPAKYDYETYSQILLHEKAHIKQGHSFDLLISELVLAFQWFNPFAWLYRKEVESNLEYLADNAVLHDAAIEMADYQMNLLKVSVPNLSLRITTNYNQSLLKKRIVMMNAKRSNIHTAWKYLFLLPMMVFMVCALNQPMMAVSKPATGKTVMTVQSQTRDEGNWKATIKGTKMEMRLYDEAEDHNYMSNSDFQVSEFTALPIERDGEFKLVREAGTMVFSGKFSGNAGRGKYKYTEDKTFTEYLRNEGITGISDDDKMAFFFLNVKKSYVAMLKHNGYKNLSKDDVISATALKVDEPYIRYWKQSGFPSLSINDLVSGRALGITPEYVNDVKKAGYTNLTFDQLVSFKAQGISGRYLEKMNGANKPAKNAKATRSPSAIPANDIISYKALNVDDAYINSLKAEGYSNLSNGKLTSLKAVGVDAAFIRSLKAAGYKNMSADDLVSTKSLGITPAFAKSFAEAGYGNVSLTTLTSLKALDITPEYLNSFKNAGYKISINDATSLKALGITSDYLNSFKDAGYKISISDATSLKALGITPEYLKSFSSVGFDKLSISDATAVKAMGITPEYISKMKEKGFKSTDINKYIQLKAAFE